MKYAPNLLRGLLAAVFEMQKVVKRYRGQDLFLRLAPDDLYFDLPERGEFLPHKKTLKNIPSAKWRHGEPANAEFVFFTHNFISFLKAGFLSQNATHNVVPVISAGLFSPPIWFFLNWYTPFFFKTFLKFALTVKLAHVKNCPLRDLINSQIAKTPLVLS